MAPKRARPKVGTAPRTHDDWITTDVLPTSDVIYRGKGLQFRHAVQLVRQPLGCSGSSGSCNNAPAMRHTVSTGDLVLVRDDHEMTKHFRIAPWNHQPWRVGQVLALVSSFQPLHPATHSTTTAAPTHGATNVSPLQLHHSAIVQWLWPIQYIQEHDKKHPDTPWMDPLELQKIKGSMRPDFMLLQPPVAPFRSDGGNMPLANDDTTLASWVNVHDILPAVATLLEWTDFRNTQWPRRLLDDGDAPCLEFFFHCHWRLPFPPGGVPVRRPRADFESAPSNVVPVTLANGWSNLHWSNVLDTTWSSSHHRAKLVHALTVSYPTSATRAPADRFQRVQPVVPLLRAVAWRDKENPALPANKRRRGRQALTAHDSSNTPATLARAPRASGSNHVTQQALESLDQTNDRSDAIVTVQRGSTCLVHKVLSKARPPVVQQLLYFCTHVTLVQPPHRPWTVRVGDVIAVAVDNAEAKQPIYTGGTNSAARPQSEWYPFAQPWCPAQVAALYHPAPPHGDGAASDQAENTLMQVRWFYRPNDLPVEVVDVLPKALQAELFRTTKTYSSRRLESGRVLIEVDEDVTETTVGAILGRVALTSERHPPPKWLNTFVSPDDGVPQLPVMCRHIFPMAEFTGTEGLSDLDPDNHWTHYSSSSTSLAFQRGLACPRAWPGRLKQLFLAYGGAVARKEPKTPKVEVKPKRADPPSPDETSIDSLKTGESDTKARTPVLPFFTDHSQGIKFFTELEINPPYESYSTIAPEGADVVDRVWTVRLGDPIILHSHGIAGRASYIHGARSVLKSNARSHSCHPFSVPWAVGEVVTIMRRRGESRDDIMIEIRWLYRKSELTVKSKATSTDDLQTEEICESDHYDEVSPSALLAPVFIHENAATITVGRSYLDMPVVEFYCQRFWSVTRKCLKPVGRLEGRIQRGRLHSSYFGKNAAMQSALTLPSPRNDITATADTEATTYQEAFERVIQKLSLTDASKEANENAAVLVGREKELQQIKAFLQGSIRNDGKGQSDMKASLFIAGPPGTGKTACVRAAVHELQRQQASAKRSSFDFITLNGMEMRDPFEAYVKLWEQLRNDDSKCSAQAAVKKLDSYFSGKGNYESDNTERVTVLLLDEIDYLETKTQSVLYNFFDWPTRSVESKSKKRLVVLGVSNTLNLPERLHPRVRSRLGSMRIFFKSYSSNETVAILNEKLRQASPSYCVFDQDAIVFAAKKTASLSGDLRKAFAIVRSAAEMVLFNAAASGDPNIKPVVCTNDVVKVCRDSSNSAQSRSVGMCAVFEVLMLVTLAALSKTTGREYGGFDVEEIVTKMESIANAHGDNLYLPPPSLSETLGIVSQLRQSHLVTVQSPQCTSLNHRASLTGCGGPWPLVSMVLDDMAIHQALKETEHAALANKFLSRSYR